MNTLPPPIEGYFTIPMRVYLCTSAVKLTTFNTQQGMIIVELENGLGTGNTERTNFGYTHTQTTGDGNTSRSNFECGEIALEPLLTSKTIDEIVRVNCELQFVEFERESLSDNNFFADIEGEVCLYFIGDCFHPKTVK